MVVELFVTLQLSASVRVTRMQIMVRETRTMAWAQRKIVVELFVTLQLSYLYENDIKNNEYEQNTNHYLTITHFL
jgi:hypothetical protein